MSGLMEYITGLQACKTDLADNLTTQGVPAVDTESFADLVDKVLDIPALDTSSATAEAGDIRTGKSAYGAAGTLLDGTLTPLDTSDADAVAAQIFEGKTAYVNGVKVTGIFKAMQNISFTITSPSIPTVGDPATS